MSSLFSLASATVGGGHRSRAGYRIDRSVRLRSSASAYFNRTQSTPTDEKKFTLSAWVKRGILSTQQTIFGGRDNATGQTPLQFTSGNAISWGDSDGVSTFYTGTTAAVFRDPSAWYHIVSVYDSNNATAADRLIIYVNGVRQTITITGSGSSIPLSRAGYWNQSGTVVEIGRTNNDPSSSFDGYITEAYFIDGQALTPSSFGETNTTTGVWQPKKYAGTYGTNGFYLNFSDNSAATAAAIGKDYSGNGNNWTPNNISVTAGVTYDSMLDVPTQWADGGNGRGNYATLNPLSMYGTNAALAGGSLTSTASSTANDRGWASTIAAPGTGKWYAEFTFTTTDSGNNGGCGIMLESGTGAPGESATTVSWRDAGTLRQNATGTSYGTALSANDIVMVAYDASLGRVWFGRNGTWFASGDPSTNANPSSTGITTTGRFASYHYGVSATIHANFGQRPFSYTPPSGFKALNTLNLPTPTILKGNQYFDIALYNNATVVSGLGFAPDLVWHKSRNQTYQHYLYDKVRGVGPKGLNSSSTAAEGTNDSLGIVSFDSSGVTYSSDAGLSQTNAVGWFWKEGAPQGFDIVTYTGTGSSSTVVSHSLGVKPSMIITKIRSSGSVGWTTTHKSLGTNMSDHYIYLNTTAASATLAGVWGAEPTSTTFGSSVNIHSPTVGATVVAYLFSEVAGFSKFGSYTGNGSADGPFVFCGFRPRWIMFKQTNTVANWYIFDTARNTVNVMDATLYPNLANAEATSASYYMDFLSNGFKQRNSFSEFNANGGTYVFAAFSESPFKYSLAR